MKKVVAVYRRFSGVQTFKAGPFIEDGEYYNGTVKATTEKSFIGCKINVDEAKQV